MTETLLEKLCCPMDKHDLEANIFTDDGEGEILEGLLSCPECQRYYPIIYGIPILIPDEYRDESLEQSMLKKWGVDLVEGGKTPFLLLEESADG
ncbi:MAG: hypothetical protein FH748_07850 [Balneolaceae bacterium]|nr:hypothetical protein [Balneolaceae bacterium]